MSERASIRGSRGGRGGRGDASSRGGRGGGAGGGGQAGGQQRDGQQERPKKENILDLKKYADKVICVKFSGGREISGTLKGYDQLMNLVLDDVQEIMRGELIFSKRRMSTPGGRGGQEDTRQCNCQALPREGRGITHRQHGTNA